MVFEEVTEKLSQFRLCTRHHVGKGNHNQLWMSSKPESIGKALVWDPLEGGANRSAGDFRFSPAAWDASVMKSIPNLFIACATLASSNNFNSPICITSPNVTGFIGKYPHLLDITVICLTATWCPPSYNPINYSIYMKYVSKILFFDICLSSKPHHLD